MPFSAFFFLSNLCIITPILQTTIVAKYVNFKAKKKKKEILKNKNNESNELLLENISFFKY